MVNACHRSFLQIEERKTLTVDDEPEGAGFVTQFAEVSLAAAPSASG